jgi:hypothetical protein
MHKMFINITYTLICVVWCMTFYYNVFGVTDMCIVSAVSIWEEDYNLLLLATLPLAWQLFSWNALSCEY